jgi:hypothetical protein
MSGIMKNVILPSVILLRSHCTIDASKEEAAICVETACYLFPGMEVADAVEQTGP